jgi:hypothetical protein
MTAQGIPQWARPGADRIGRVSGFVGGGHEKRIGPRTGVRLAAGARQRRSVLAVADPITAPINAPTPSRAPARPIRPARSDQAVERFLESFAADRFFPFFRDERSFPLAMRSSRRCEESMVAESCSARLAASARLPSPIALALSSSALIAFDGEASSSCPDRHAHALQTDAAACNVVATMASRRPARRLEAVSSRLAGAGRDGTVTRLQRPGWMRRVRPGPPSPMFVVPLILVPPI